MAGTVFDYAGAVGDNAIHWLHVDNTGTGTTTFSKERATFTDYNHSGCGFYHRYYADCTGLEPVDQ